MQTNTLALLDAMDEAKTRRNPRGVFQKVPGKYSPWWIRYTDAQGRFRREKAGTKSAAIDLYRKRKNEALEGKKLPDKLRRAAVSFKDISKDALAYSKTNKRSYRDDEYRMKQLVDWFGPRVADSITPQEIERTLADTAELRKWCPATSNRHRSLLSMTYRLAIRDGKVRENPVRQVPRKRENNIRTRFLDAKEEVKLRTKIRVLHPEREPEFDLGLHTGMRRNEQHHLRWQDVNLRAGIITIPQTKHGGKRHVPINSVAERALTTLSKGCNGSDYVCLGPDQREGRDWERWFEDCIDLAGIPDFRWHDLRHTFASRLAMAGVPLRTLAELLGHKTLAMVMRYAHLAPAHLRDAVERIAETPTDTTTDTRPSEAPEQRPALPNQVFTVQ